MRPMQRPADAGRRASGERAPARPPATRTKRRARATRRARRRERAPSFPALQQRVEARERLVGRRRRGFTRSRRCDPARLVLLSLVFVVMAIDAKQFPVASIRRIVVVVVIAMVDGE